MATQEVGDIVYVRLRGKAGKVRAQNGAYREFIADDPVSFGDQVQYDLKDGTAYIRKRIKPAMKD